MPNFISRAGSRQASAARGGTLRHDASPCVPQARWWVCSVSTRMAATMARWALRHMTNQFLPAGHHISDASLLHSASSKAGCVARLPGTSRGRWSTTWHRIWHTCGGVALKWLLYAWCSGLGRSTRRWTGGGQLFSTPAAAFAWRPTGALPQAQSPETPVQGHVIHRGQLRGINDRSDC